MTTFAACVRACACILDWDNPFMADDLWSLTHWNKMEAKYKRARCVWGCRVYQDNWDTAVGNVLTYDKESRTEQLSDVCWERLHSLFLSRPSFSYRWYLRRAISWNNRLASCEMCSLSIYLYVMFLCHIVWQQWKILQRNFLKLPLFFHFTCEGHILLV